MRPILIAALIAMLSACTGDETLRAYGAADKTWHLTQLNGADFTATTTLTFPAPGKMAGQAPCNSFTAPMTVPYPWFDAGPVAATRLACPDMAAETAFFTALDAAALSEVLGDTMILSNDAGLSMVFKANG